MSIGLPLALQEFLTQLSFLALCAFVNRLGLTASSGYGVASKIVNFAMLIPCALMQSMASFVAQNVGAGNQKRAKQSMLTGIGVGLVFGCAVFALVMLKGDVLAGIFSPDAEVVQKGFEYLASAGVFLLAVVLLITHAQTELSVACIGVIVAILTLIVLGLTSGKKSVIEIIKGVDYKTLLFFIGLFVSVAGLEKTGVLNMIANFITSVSEGNIAVIVIVILWLSAITSAFVDNIPFAATMIPVIRAIAATEGMDIGVLAWALSLGTDLGGNATPIGASANVVGTSASAKGGYPIGWGRYCKYCVPATIIVMAVSTAYLFLRYL